MRSAPRASHSRAASRDRRGRRAARTSRRDRAPVRGDVDPQASAGILLSLLRGRRRDRSETDCPTCCRSAVGGILARPYARHIGLAGGLVVAFLLRPIVVVDSEATSLLYRRGLVGLLAIERQAIGCFDRENRHGLALPFGVANTLGPPRLR